MGQYPDPEFANRAAKEFVLAYFPDDVVLSVSGSGSWSLYQASAWDLRVRRVGAVSFDGGINTDMDELRDRIQDRVGLYVAVTMQRRWLYWVTVDAERRVFPMHHVRPSCA